MALEASGSLFLEGGDFLKASADNVYQKRLPITRGRRSEPAGRHLRLVPGSELSIPAG